MKISSYVRPIIASHYCKETSDGYLYIRMFRILDAHLTQSGRDLQYSILTGIRIYCKISYKPDPDTDTDSLKMITQNGFVYHDE